MGSKMVSGIRSDEEKEVETEKKEGEEKQE